MINQSIFDYTFSEVQVNQLMKYRDLQEDYRLNRRFMIFILIAEGVSKDIVCKTYKISPKTIENWFKIYVFKGINALNTFNKKKKKRIFAK